MTNYIKLYQKIKDLKSSIILSKVPIKARKKAKKYKKLFDFSNNDVIL